MRVIQSYRLMDFILVLLALVLLQGCASVAYLPGQQTIGKLRTIGKNVMVNGKPAHDSQTITSGDHVATGAASSAYIYFLSGGFIQLDENTDPGFALVWDKTQCIFHFFDHRKGRAFQHTTPDDCPSFYETPLGKWFRNHTQFNVQVNQQQTVMTVLEGNMEMVTPKRMNQLQGQQMIVTKDGVQSVRQLTGQELREVTRWRKDFPEPKGGSGRCGECAD